MLRTRRRTGVPGPRSWQPELPERTRFGLARRRPRMGHVHAAADGFWEAWSRLDGFERVVADPERNDWRIAITSFAQVLERQAERDLTVTLDRFFEHGRRGRVRVDPLLPHRAERRNRSL